MGKKKKNKAVKSQVPLKGTVLKDKKTATQKSSSNNIPPLQSGERPVVENKSFLGIIIALLVLFLLALGIWGIIKLLNGTSNTNDVDNESSTSVSATVQDKAEDNVNDGSDSSETAGNEGTESSNIGDGESVNAGSEQNNGGSVDGSMNGDINGDGVMNYLGWVANDYKTGDISGDTYTVKSGDTLWEIADGRYGDGLQWEKIKDANLEKVGFLPSGERALIFPGQELVLP